MILAISPPLLVVLLPSESSSLHDVPWLGATYDIGTYFVGLYTREFITQCCSLNG